MKDMKVVRKALGATMQDLKKLPQWILSTWWQIVAVSVFCLICWFVYMVIGLTGAVVVAISGTWFLAVFAFYYGYYDEQKKQERDKD